MNNKEAQLVRSLLETIQWISDKDYQRRIWINAEGPECNDFGETVNMYSSDIDWIFQHYQQCTISEIQILILRKFHNKFKEFWQDNDWPASFIDTLEWNEIVEMAKEVLREFHYNPETSE